MALEFEDPDPLPPPLAKTKRSPSYSLSSASGDNLITSRKSRHAEPGTTDVHAERASISMPPPSGRPIINSRPSSTISNRRPSEASEFWGSSAGSPRPEFAIEDFETPKLAPGSMSDFTKHPILPEAALNARSSSTDLGAKRMSTSSIYSLSSARAGGGQSSAASANGSEAGTRPTSGSISGGKTPGISQPETSTSVLSVTTSSMAQYNVQGVPIAHQLMTRDSTTAEVPRRSPASRGDNGTRPSVQRSRSRAQRRFSGSTAPSSHSPSSERGFGGKDRDEGRFCIRQRPV